jgi:hypothetical protein
VFERQRAEVMGDDPQLARPVTVGGVHRELAQGDPGETYRKQEE